MFLEEDVMNLNEAKKVVACMKMFNLLMDGPITAKSK